MLEIIEQSLDTNLCSNQVRYKFPDAPILDGISIYERGSIVIMLVPTVSSVHRLTFLHPSFDVSSLRAIVVRYFKYIFQKILMFAETFRLPIHVHILRCYRRKSL